MRRQAFRWLVLLMCVLLTGCSQPKLNVLFVCEKNDEGYIVSDGVNAYDWYDGELIPRGQMTAYHQPIAPFETFGTEYKLTYKDLASYEGTIQDAGAYVNYLLTLDYSLTSLKYNVYHLDVLLKSERDEIRVLYLGGDSVRIFYKNFVDGSMLPPYIYEKGK